MFPLATVTECVCIKLAGLPIGRRGAQTAVSLQTLTISHNPPVTPHCQGCGPA